MSIARIFWVCNVGAAVMFSSVSAASYTYQEAEPCQQKLKDSLRDKRHRTTQGCPVTQKLITWIAAQQEDSSLSFGEMKKFMDENPDFPAQHKLTVYAEKKMGLDLTSREVVAWFDAHPPKSPDGAITYARALLAQNRTDILKTYISQAWRDVTLLTHHNKKFLADFGSYLTTADHDVRLDAFLWNGDVESARMLLELVSPSKKQTATKRMAMMAGQGVSMEGLGNDEGVLYEAAKYYRTQEKYDQAASLILKAHTSSEHADIWWKERNYVAREYLKTKRYADALALIESHGLTSGENFSAAAFMSGWLQLRFMNAPEKALPHFVALYEGVLSPISRSRGAYWAGRAEEAQGHIDNAEKWYLKAATYKTTFYGQLASGKLEEALIPVLYDHPQVDPVQRTIFSEQDVVKAAQLLSQAGPEGRYELRKFMWHIGESAEDNGAAQLAVELAHHIAPHDVVWTAKKATKTEHVPLKVAFPVKTIPQKGQRAPEPAFVHAFIYQESRFDPHETSAAGAKGLMQLMPATASREAKDLGLHDHREEKLLQDPEHNMILGSHHIGRLLDEMGGNYVLTIAAYNAGKNPVDRWLAEYGDPRKGEIDIIDWIELIPYYETRNYVQRVLENLTVYRSLHGESHRTILHDLVG